MKGKTSKGITLIALVITIIVLLILTGVSIGSLTGENGILNKAVAARKISERAGIIEEIQLDILDKLAGNQGGSLTQGELKIILTKYVEDAETDIKYDETDTSKIASIITKKGNHEIPLSEIWGGTTKQDIPTQDTPTEKTVLEYAIEAKPTTATITETDKTKGIVMVDDNSNEWVWIEVPKEVFKTATSNKAYDAIKADLIEYAKDYRKGSIEQDEDWIDEWYALDGEILVTASTEGLTDTQKALNNGCGLTYDEYNTAYQTMLSSVYDNKGFYIARYEAGIKGSDTDTSLARDSRTAITSSTPEAVSKENMIPYNYVYCSDAQTLARNMATGGKTSSLMFGIQWDLVCKYLEVNGDWDTTTNTAKYYINENSTSWGNYLNNSLTLKSGRYLPNGDLTLYSWTEYNVNTDNFVASSQTLSSYSLLLTTGASEGTNKMNIYDFAGNEYEWTLERTTTTDDPCAVRGAYYDDSGSDYPVSDRGIDSTTGSYDSIGFRASLY